MNKLLEFIPELLDLQITDIRGGLSEKLSRDMFEAILGGDKFDTV